MSKFKQTNIKLHNCIQVLSAEISDFNIARDPIIAEFLKQGAKIRGQKKYAYSEHSPVKNLLSTRDVYLFLGEPFMTFEHDGEMFEVYNESQMLGSCYVDEFAD